MVSVMKLEKAPKETYADVGGLEAQIQEIKARFILFVFCKLFRILCKYVLISTLQEAVELPLTHPEYYEEMGIRAPKGIT